MIKFGYGVLIRRSVHMSVLLYVHQLFISPFPPPSTMVAHSHYQFCYLSPLFWYCIHLWPHAQAKKQGKGRSFEFKKPRPLLLSIHLKCMKIWIWKTAPWSSCYSRALKRWLTGTATWVAGKRTSPMGGVPSTGTMATPTKGQWCKACRKDKLFTIDGETEPSSSVKTRLYVSRITK